MDFIRMKFGGMEFDVDVSEDGLARYDPVTRQVIHWIDRMNLNYGHQCLDREAGKFLDWGQALARELYGPTWTKINYPADPPEKALPIMGKWEAGEFPVWLAEPHRITN